jgi:hypothetical protein
MVTLGNILMRRCQLVNNADSTSDICMETRHKTNDTKVLKCLIPRNLLMADHNGRAF